LHQIKVLAFGNKGKLQNFVMYIIIFAIYVFLIINWIYKIIVFKILVKTAHSNNKHIIVECRHQSFGLDAPLIEKCTIIWTLTLVIKYLVTVVKNF